MALRVIFALSHTDISTAALPLQAEILEACRTATGKVMFETLPVVVGQQWNALRRCRGERVAFDAVFAPNGYLEDVRNLGRV